MGSSGLGPTKKEIADHLGLDRSTVSKILNHYNRERFSRDTVERVEEAARVLGYMKSQRRESPRQEAEATARFRIYLRDGSLWGEGSGVIKDFSANGFLLGKLKLNGDHLPAAPHYYVLEVQDDSLNGLEYRCRPVRLIEAEGERFLNVGLTFDGPGNREKKALERLVRGIG
ncbi:MAG: helix-turn-helix domain-containing protein [Planctomycetota bacterium]|nr:helix-turn-helix domain-containing protein [Planctomycetota bacterium]